jgi:hypothetical protein
MVPLLILGGLAAIVYAIYRAYRRWGVCALWFFCAGVSFLNWTGTASEYLWGPLYSWNFAHHKDWGGALIFSVFYFGIGLISLRNRRNGQPPRSASGYFTPRRPV